MSHTPIAYTDEQMRDLFLEHIAAMVRYWDKHPGSNSFKLEGLTHSILAALDGCSAALPGFKVIPYPHPDDYQYAVDNEKKYYYPDNVDIGGGLHEHIHKYFKNVSPNL